MAVFLHLHWAFVRAPFFHFAVANFRGGSPGEDLAKGDLSKENLLRVQGELRHQHKFFTCAETLVQEAYEGAAHTHPPLWTYNDGLAIPNRLNVLLAFGNVIFLISKWKLYLRDKHKIYQTHADEDCPRRPEMFLFPSGLLASLSRKIETQRFSFIFKVVTQQTCQCTPCPANPHLSTQAPRDYVCWENITARGSRSKSAGRLHLLCSPCALQVLRVPPKVQRQVYWWS